MSLLEVEGLRTGYGPVPVLHGIDLRVDEGTIAVLVGLNGAGKTTTLMSIAGLLPRWAGRIEFGGEAIHDLDSHERVARGIVLVPEGRHVFPGLSVENNLRLGAWPRRRDPRFVREAMDRVFDVFPVLRQRRAQTAGTLSGGEQQMLAIGRGLMSGPRLLLIDEASLGLSPKLAQQVFRTVARIGEQGVTVLMVEQNASALELAARASIMEKGRIVYEGPGRELLHRAELRTAYLGTPA